MRLVEIQGSCLSGLQLLKLQQTDH